MPLGMPVWLICTILGQDPLIHAAEFSKLVRGEHSWITDVEFVFEGESQRIDGTIDGSCGSFQGTFACRIADGATYMDVYRHPKDSEFPFAHATTALLKSELRKYERWPDQGIIDPRPLVTRGRTATLNDIDTPLRFFLVWYFAGIDDPTAEGYEYQGWEQIDGHRCLRIQFDEAKGATGPGRPVIRMWLDMERGAHPLKIQFWRQGSIVAQTQNIRLIQFTVQGGLTFWFPISADSYNGNPDTSKTVTKWRCYVVRDTIRFNQNLSDARFDVNWKRHARSTDRLSQARQLFESQFMPKSAPVAPTGRNDSHGVRELLEQRLAEADKQARELQASSPAREVMGPVQYAMVGCITFGACLLLAIVFCKWRSRWSGS